ncbi:hypothetical protein [Sinomonas susongensis]|uniref:hypothetical protein n=1 Tax=Sinomonas susongensis TaxID=1324851 RepID=UPI001107BB88|nr:hypothetical protein [Sinomonas susongensis]
MITAAIPFVQTDAHQNPNLRRKTDPTESYMRAMAVAFASLSRWNSDIELVLVTNSELRRGYQEWLERLNVEVYITSFAHRPPKGFMNQFEGCLFLLDALPVLAGRDVLYLDPDVLCIAPIALLMDQIEGFASGIILDTPVDDDINGLSRREAAQLHVELEMPEGIPEHIGGEAYFVPQHLSASIIENSERAWHHALERFANGKPGFKTEEHILSYALRRVPLKPMNLYARRIWTAHRYRTVRGDEGSLTLWHLPAEKDRGFAALFGPSQDRDSWFWGASRTEFVRRSSRAMGLHGRSPKRLVLDLLGAVANRWDHDLLRR